MRLFPPILLSCSLLLVHAVGQVESTPAAAPESAAPAEPAKPAPDFSRAFGLLRSLGLPSVKDALPRKSEQEYYGGEEGMGILASYLWEKKGPDGGRTLVLGQTLEIPAVNRSTENGMDNRQQMEMMMMMSMGRSGATQHAAEVLAALSRPMEVNRLRNGTPDLEMAKKITGIIGKLKPEAFEQWYVEGTLNGLGRVLLFATQLDERGHREAANRLAETALSTPLGAEPVISTAITLLAEAAYAQSMQRFLNSSDLKAWKTDLDGLLAKFSRGYANTIAVKLALADAATALEPKPLALPEAEALAKEWRAKKLDEPATKRIKDALSIVTGDESSRGYYDNFWSGEGDKPAPPVPWILDTGLAKSEDPLGKILAKGPDALPLLLALATDGSATANASSLLQSQRNSYNYSSQRASAEEVAILHYQTKMPRPLTVGEIATALLASVLTGLEENESLPRPDEMPDLVEAWLGSLPARTPEALADHYFELGNDPQKSAALRIFLASPDPAKLKKAEDFLLAARPRAENLELLTEYLTERGSEGADFFARYRKVVEEEIENAAGDYLRDDWSVYENSMAKAKKQALARLKPLEALIKGVDLDKLFVEIAAKDDPEELREELVLLSTALGKLKPEEAISRWLAATVRTSKPVARKNLLMLASYTLPKIPMAEAHREGWKTLLEDSQNPFNKEQASEMGMVSPTVGKLAAQQWHSLHASEPKIPGRHYRLAQVLGEDGLMDILLARAKASVAGSPVPVWPDEEKLSAPELESLLAKLNGLPAAEVADAVKALSHKEKFTLLQLEKPYEAFGKASLFIHEVTLPKDYEEALAFVEDWKGQALTDAMVHQLIESGRKEVKNGFDINVYSDSLIPGLQITAVPSSGSQYGTRELKKPGVIAGFRGNLLGSEEADSMTVRTTFLSEEDLGTMTEEDKKIMEEERQKFNEGLAKLLDPSAKTQAVYLSLSLDWMAPGKPIRRRGLRSIFEE